MAFKCLTSFAAALLISAPAFAKDEASTDNYIEANLISIFYHELGHAMIDIMALPVFGQEEDAADTASVLLIDALYDDETAKDIARDAAFGFLDEAETSGDTPAWWDVHGPDLQRYYNLVCLFYGADPDARAHLAAELELPEDRADSCEEEFDLAVSSWGPVIDDIAQAGAGETIQYEGTAKTLTERLISDEVAALNAEFSLPETLKVEVKACDEANAYYDPETVSITICSEFESHLRILATEN
ncbi:MAG: DUF4344 domain-containing metallopeptidase [Sulfitobacter sp.]